MRSNEGRGARPAIPSWGGIALLVLAAALGAAILAGGPPRGGEPSYEAWQAHLRAGDGKDGEEGTFELYQVDPTRPTAWNRVAIEGGVTHDVLVTGPTYVPPDPGGQVPVDWRERPDLDFASVQALVDWIVATYDHVNGPTDLVVEVR